MGRDGGRTSHVGELKVGAGVEGVLRKVTHRAVRGDVVGRVLVDGLLLGWRGLLLLYIHLWIMDDTQMLREYFRVKIYY